MTVTGPLGWPWLLDMSNTGAASLSPATSGTAAPSGAFVIDSVCPVPIAPAEATTVTPPLATFVGPPSDTALEPVSAGGVGDAGVTGTGAGAAGIGAGVTGFAVFFQTSFLPFFLHLNVPAAVVTVLPRFLHFFPAFGAFLLARTSRLVTGVVAESAAADTGTATATDPPMVTASTATADVIDHMRVPVVIKNVLT